MANIDALNEKAEMLLVSLINGNLSTVAEQYKQAQTPVKTFFMLKLARHSLELADYFVDYMTPSFEARTRSKKNKTENKPTAINPVEKIETDINNAVEENLTEHVIETDEIRELIAEPIDDEQYSDF